MPLLTFFNGRIMVPMPVTPKWVKRGARVDVVEDIKDVKGRVRLKVGSKATILSTYLASDATISIQPDNRRYPINDCPIRCITITP